MTEQHSTTRPNRPVRAIMMTMGFLICGDLLLHWSWNTLATGPFTIPGIQFKHALALELFLVAVYLIPNAASQLIAGSHKP
jgi:hypothetical protein